MKCCQESSENREGMGREWEGKGKGRGREGKGRGRKCSVGEECQLINRSDGTQ